MLAQVRKLIPFYQKIRDLFPSMVRRIFLSFLHGRNLQCIVNHTANINKKDIILFCTLRNEVIRIPYFLDYYRSLGVDHFIFVDNGSSDGFMGYVRDMEDVSVWFTDASYKKSNFGMHWLNYLLRKHGTKHWCVVCDPDEFLVYPRSTTRGLHDLSRHLDQEGKTSLFALMLDMYDVYVDSAQYQQGKRPWDVCSYFDKFGYSADIDPWLTNLHIQGGVRQRVFYRDKPELAPALNKIPFVKWRRHYSYVSSMHCLIPRAPNYTYSSYDITGCLLHFKFISAIVEKSKEEMARGEHYDNSSEYKKYFDALSTRQQLYDAKYSVEYEGWQQLVSHGLMNPASWRF